jgi:RNA polymerase sigma factor (sigma-70 family)
MDPGRDDNPQNLARSDADWVVLARDGCQRSCYELYQRHAGRLMPMLWRMSGGDAARAQDWLQECFIKAWSRLDQLDDPLRFGAWLKRLAINLVVSDRRRPELLLQTDGLEHQAAPSPPWPAADLDLERAIAALPDRARQVLILFCLEGLTHAEIARIMVIDEGTSKGQLHRARQLLKDRLS